MKDLLKEKIEEIVLKLIEDYHIPEGKTTEEAIDQLYSLFQEELKKKKKMKINLSEELVKINKLRVKAHIGMRLIFRSIVNPSISVALAKLFLIEDNWAFWETVKRNEFWRYDFLGRLASYYNAIQKWYNNYSKLERGKDEWLYFGDEDLPWKKDKVEFTNLMASQINNQDK